VKTKTIVFFGELKSFQKLDAKTNLDRHFNYKL